MDLTKKIKPLEREDWLGYKLVFNYTANSYYDVQIDKEDTGFNVSFEKKNFETPILKTDEVIDQLFAPRWDDIKAWGIVEDGKLLAVVETVVESWNNRLRVTELWVDDSLHRQGLGTALMDIAINRAKEEARRVVVLETQTCNENAINFYLAYGFSLIGFDSCAYKNNDIQRKEVRIELGLFL